MNHAKKKRGVPDAMSGTPLRSVCGILCGQQKSAKPYSFKKLPKPKENTRNPKISGVVLWAIYEKDATRKYPSLSIDIVYVCNNHFVIFRFQSLQFRFPLIQTSSFEFRFV